jgi:hypothetical protein
MQFVIGNHRILAWYGAARNGRNIRLVYLVSLQLRRTNCSNLLTLPASASGARIELNCSDIHLQSFYGGNCLVCLGAQHANDTARGVEKR